MDTAESCKEWKQVIGASTEKNLEIKKIVNACLDAVGILYAVAMDTVIVV